VLIFEAASKLPVKKLLRDLAPILFLAILGMLLTTGIAAALLFVGIGHPSGFPWIAALLAGALLSATDPVAVVAQLKTLGAPERLSVLLEGESLFNDATAIVLFTILLSIATLSGEVGLGSGIVSFAITFFGGALVGLGVGGIAVLLLRAAGGDIHRAVVSAAAAYGSFLLAEAGLHVSGVMASLAAGLTLACAIQPSGENAVDGQLGYFWGVLAYIANGCVFLLMGLTITIEMFEERWLAMLIAIVAVLIARAGATMGGLSLMNLLLPERVPVNYQLALVWGGLRGAVTVALALSLPVDLEYWWTIQSMAFGVVLFTLFVQAPTTPMLLRRAGLTA
jgi:CPA1 family monovalent cation:H+ antiporter